uniref:Uncharacterized protein n=1 Tax=uncultured Candidatus Melainabacteria bacterium TaxID=2682970 RepID=A0A650EKE5_9BACT|nr:hypothetical protein Melaina855_0780 [uncultured Candidatus Melainabacteria bacterium]
MSDDVRKNFTYEISTEGLCAKNTIKGSFIAKGITYGQEYELNVNRQKAVTTITGKIGTKGVDVKSERQGGFFSGKYNIEGYVGNKKILISEKAGLTGDKRFIGKFGDEDISLTYQHFRHNDMITGVGVDMQLMYYAEFGSKPKYVGKYKLSPEFLPIFAALNRFL